MLGLKEKDDTPAIRPTEENVNKGTYPLARNLYFYLDPEKNAGVAAQFIAFCKSPEGQAIVSEVGYYPLKAKPASSAETGTHKDAPSCQGNSATDKEGKKSQ